MDRLEQLHRTLVEGQQRSMQGSYARREPAAEARPLLEEARRGLWELARERPGDAAVWRLLSTAEECLLHYPAALGCLERALGLSAARDRKDLKRLAALKEAAARWQELMLTPAQLAALGAFLAPRLQSAPCTHTLQLTQEWLEGLGSRSAERVAEALRRHGGACDCEVLANVVRG